MVLSVQTFFEKGLKMLNVPVYTLLHGDQLRKRTGEIELVNDRSEVSVDSLMTIQIRHPAVLEHYNLLLFDGLLVPGGMNQRVLLLDSSIGSGCRFVTVNRSNVKDVREGDFESPTATPLRTWDAFHVSQTLYRRALAIPKGNVRGLILTFHDRSLEPWYRVVRSLPEQVIVETANSY